MSDMDEGKRPDRLDLLLTDYFRPESAAAELPRRIAAAARESSAALGPSAAVGRRSRSASSR